MAVTVKVSLCFLKSQYKSIESMHRKQLIKFDKHDIVSPISQVRLVLAQIYSGWELSRKSGSRTPELMRHHKSNR